MEDLRAIIKKLLPVVELRLMSAEEIVGHVACTIYEPDFLEIRKYFDQMPIVLKDIILLIDLDTELTMNGIIGFLENSTGYSFEETIEALVRIQATMDLEIMNKIKSILKSNGIHIQALRDNVNNQTNFQVSSFSEIHGESIRDIMKIIEEIL